MRKIFLQLFVFVFLALQCNANDLSKFVSKMDFGLNSIVSVYLEDAKTGEILYKKNEKKLMNPASTLKTLTFGASNIVLGSDYEFETALYKYGNDLYLKLGGDALLSKNDLVNIFSQFKKENPNFNINKIYIDDSIFETFYPDTWMEEDLWPCFRIITPYIIDNNMFEVAINRSSLSKRVEIVQNDSYKLPIVNELVLGDRQEYIIERHEDEDSSIVYFKGAIIEDEQIKLPVLKPEINFKIKLNEALRKNNIIYEEFITSKITPQDASKIASVSHNISDISNKVLHDSKNFYSEIVFMVAAAKYINYSHVATSDDAIKMFRDIYKKHITDDIKIADGSGVSRENFVNAIFMTESLKELYSKTDLKTFLTTSNEGTLADRMLFLKDNLRAKTGTLSQTSAILGTLKTKQGRDVVFSIAVQNSSKRKALLKHFENTLITKFYRMF